MGTREKVQAALVPLVHEVGYAGLTYEGLAAASGAAKTTLYRHWPSRAELVFDLVLHDRALAPLRVEGSRAQVADALAERVVAFLSADGALAVMAGLLAELAASPELASRFRAGFVRDGEREMAAVLAALRGERPSGTPWADGDVQLALLGAAQGWLTVGGLAPAGVRDRVARLALAMTGGE